MVKINELLAAAEATSADSPYFAIEFFPPRTPEGLEKLYERCPRFKAQGVVHMRIGCGVIRVWLARVAGCGCCIVCGASFHFPLLVAADPLYADVTWGAGGSTSDLTLDICVKMKEEFGLEPNMHITWYVCCWICR